jgi:hypothetical protein
MSSFMEYYKTGAEQSLVNSQRKGGDPANIKNYSAPFVSLYEDDMLPFLLRCRPILAAESVLTNLLFSKVISLALKYNI